MKCNRDAKKNVCQNEELLKAKNIDIDYEEIVDRYVNNKITSAIVFGGLEPLMSPMDVVRLIHAFRQRTNDPIIIYTGYNEDEIEIMSYITQYKNIIMKFGRFIADQKPHKDDTLGVELASDNQYAKKIS